MGGALFADYDEHPKVRMEATAHKLARAFHATLRRTAVSLDEAMNRLKEFNDYLKEKVESDYVSFGSSYTYYTGLRADLTKARAVISSADPLKRQEASEDREAELRFLAPHVRTLLLAQDGPRVDKAVRKELGASPQKGFTTDARMRGLSHEIAKQQYESLTVLRKYLRDNHVNFSIAGQGRLLSRTPDTGNPPNPYFRTYIDPFIDVITQPSHPVRIGVCEVCNRVYVRKKITKNYKNTRGTACDGHCANRLHRGEAQ